MNDNLTAALAAQLREPFPPEKVSKLPKVTCGGCRDARGRVCDKHRKGKCGDCGAWITDAHLHLDYVGHADTTDRLLEVDPAWSWEPLALGADGLPLFDGNGGLWIRLTVAGVTRLGYGDADGKRGGNAVKEAIGDAIRNAAMRFGVALDLWRKETHVDESTAPRQGEWEQASRPPTDFQRATFAELSKAITEAPDADALNKVMEKARRAYLASAVTQSQSNELRAQWDARAAALRAEPVGDGGTDG